MGDQQEAEAEHSSPADTHPRRRWLRRTVWVAVALVLLSGAWLAVTGFLAYRESQTLTANLRAAESAAREANLSALAAALPEARDSAHRLQLLTSGPVWWAAAHVPLVPYVGPSANAVRELASVGDDLFNAAAPLQQPLQSVAAGNLRTADGALNLELLQQSIPALRETATAVTQAQQRLSAINTKGLPARLGKPIKQLRAQLPTFVPLANSLADAAERVPPLLGADGPRTWLVLLQNPGEARGTGGFIGGYALVTADHGKITIDKVGANDELVAHQPIDYSALPADTRSLWGRDLAEWQSINLSPHFPYTGQLAVQGMKQIGTTIDGVIAVDPQVVSVLLAATGPAKVGERTITADTAVDYVTRQVYVDQGDSAKKDQALLSLFTQTLQKLTTGSVDLPVLMRGLALSVDGHHLQAYSTNKAEQAWLEATPVGGVISNEPGPHVVIALNNGAGNKIDAFIHTSAEYQYGHCPGRDYQFSNLNLTLANKAPADLPNVMNVRNDDPNAPAAGERMLVEIYAPGGSFLLEATLNGEPEPIGNGTDRGHPVWRFVVDVDRGASRTLALKFSEPTVKGATATLQVPAMVVPATVSVTPSTDCAQ
ncbi:MAG: DUF4012 domain-containing protein [Actinomycetes bacterium]